MAGGFGVKPLRWHDVASAAPQIVDVRSSVLNRPTSRVAGPMVRVGPASPWGNSTTVDRMIFSLDQATVNATEHLAAFCPTGPTGPTMGKWTP